MLLTPLKLVVRKLVVFRVNSRPDRGRHQYRNSANLNSLMGTVFDSGYQRPGRSSGREAVCSVRPTLPDAMLVSLLLLQGDEQPRTS